MSKSLKKIISGYQIFRKKYASGDESAMHTLSTGGQKPEIMIISCSDSRVDPALLLQCDPGDLFVVRNVANIVPPFETSKSYHGTSAALEFGICHLNVKSLIILGHSQCGGIHALLNKESLRPSDFIESWVSIIQPNSHIPDAVDDCAQSALKQSRDNCLTFPWIQERITNQQLTIDLWFLDIKKGQLLRLDDKQDKYLPLEDS